MPEKLRKFVSCAANATAFFDADLGEAMVIRQGQGAFDFVEYACRCPHCGYLCSKTVNTCCPEQLSMAIGKYGNEVKL